MTLTPPPFDPELAAALEMIKDTLLTQLTMDEIEATRNGPGIEMWADMDLTLGGAFEVEDRVVPGPENAPDISLLICRPVDPATDGPLPVIYHVHGGGMVLGNNRVGVDAPLRWANELGAVVVSVEYRLAPENPYPAPIDDVYAGLLWIAGHAEEIGADAERIVITGASAGGGLTAALALLLRDRKGPRPVGQMLMCPMLDDRNDTPSVYQMEGLGAWDRTANDTGWTALLGERRGGPDVSPYAAPARAEDLSGLPPAFLDVGSAETFRDEVVAYATRLWQAGGAAELHVWPGGFHGFESFAPQAVLSQACQAAQVAWLRRLLAE
ncbi:alpha/beta hydrolase [Streptomyces europaeiscabiei]|uniref:Alpha/beta hydrolase n=1 Tax=Streptomyces europaeiscabiei TaxID=146819 RepID=A0ABU4NVD6_9ACTN|nr:alpha/beta hydrolase [Streptomyces europaeiscabiei]MDX2530856.1 alpha/beta hydrolase [Streptomyces europaeiscabiei]MDX2757223.1 alpha/beta hydrolase [Streptomyces europaeiscabiei]MDX2768259.1 alpha/beta hydrolase [Streptomyces europaeiscabiei]MDX3549328.1 alpha/beta hydrolase [Streptomyces europaeiscabiei]MDX3558598.1 alpha/beta hydrolase [Streptomyces europaeiscabiei]